MRLKLSIEGDLTGASDLGSKLRAKVATCLEAWGIEGSGRTYLHFASCPKSGLVWGR